MNDFYSTNGGRRFIDGTMVRIADSLDEINKSLKIIVAKEAREMRTYMDNEMYLASNQKSDHEYMDRKIKERESNE